MNPRNQSYIVYILLFVAIVALLVYNYGSSNNSSKAISINEVAQGIKDGEITRIVENENRLTIYYLAEGIQGTSTKESSATLIEQLIQLGVSSEDLHPDKIRIEIKPPSPVLGLLPHLVIFCRSLFLVQHFSSFSARHRAVIMLLCPLENQGRECSRGDQPTVTFDDVAGVDESKEELERSG